MDIEYVNLNSKDRTREKGTEMKNLEDAHKMMVLHSGIFFAMGIIGTFYPESAKFIVNFCFIYGGSTLIQSVIWLAKVKKEKDK